VNEDLGTLRGALETRSSAGGSLVFRDVHQRAWEDDGAVELELVVNGKVGLSNELRRTVVIFLEI